MKFLSPLWVTPSLHFNTFYIFVFCGQGFLKERHQIIVYNQRLYVVVYMSLWDIHLSTILNINKVNCKKNFQLNVKCFFKLRSLPSILFLSVKTQTSASILMFWPLYFSFKYPVRSSCIMDGNTIFLRQIFC